MTPEVSLFSKSAWEALADILEKRLLATPSWSEEDLRHCAVDALESFGMFPKGSICLNYEHTSFRRKKIDIFLPAFSRQSAIACELKYDRAIPSGYRQPVTNKAGAIVNDFLRLAHFNVPTEIERFLIYLTDQEMRTYLRNPRNGFSALFKEEPWPHLVINSRFVDERVPSLKEKIKVPMINCSVFTVLNQNIGNKHDLTVFLVRPE